MNQQTVSEQAKQFLLTLARQSITNALNKTKTPLEIPDALKQELDREGATFVTLHVASTGNLRGCIGSIVAHRELVDDVHHNALAAAFEDPRFPALHEEELADLHIEVSVLTPMQPLAYDDAHDLLAKLRPDIDGVLIEKGWHRATFLPQVWAQLPTHEQFLGHLCQKAGLSAYAWQAGDLKISTYQVIEFSEELA